VKDEAEGAEEEDEDIKDKTGIASRKVVGHQHQHQS